MTNELRKSKASIRKVPGHSDFPATRFLITIARKKMDIFLNWYFLYKIYVKHSVSVVSQLLSVEEELDAYIFNQLSKFDVTPMPRVSRCYALTCARKFYSPKE